VVEASPTMRRNPGSEHGNHLSPPAESPVKPRILRLVPLPPKGETSPIENIVVKPIDLDDLRHHLATTKDQFDALDNDTWVANVKPEEWSQIIERATEGLKLQVANSSAAPISVLDKLAKDPELWVKQALSKNPSGSESAIEKVGTNSYSYLPAVADKINTPKTQPAKSDGLLVEPPLINKNRSNLRQDHLTYVAGFILFLLVQGLFFFSAVNSGEKNLIDVTIISIMFYGFLFSVFYFGFARTRVKNVVQYLFQTAKPL
jgi:hypothetical protein